MGDIWRLLDRWFSIKPRYSTYPSAPPQKEPAKPEQNSPVKITIEVPSGSEVKINSNGDKANLNANTEEERPVLIPGEPIRYRMPELKSEPTLEEKKAVMRDEMWAAIRRGHEVRPKTELAKKVYQQILKEQDTLK